MAKTNIPLVLFLSFQLMACGSSKSSDSLQQWTGTQPPPAASAPSSAQELNIDNGTYLSVYQFNTSFWPYPLISITINGHNFTANYQFSILTADGMGATIPLIQTGTFSLAAKGLFLTQQALYLIPGTGQAQDLVPPYFVASGLIFNDNTPTSVAGLNYQFLFPFPSGSSEANQSFSANGSVIQPGIIQTNEGTLSWYQPDAMIAPPPFKTGALSLMYSLILQTPLPQFQPTTTTPKDGTFTAPQRINDPEVLTSVNALNSPAQFVYLDSISISGGTYTTAASLLQENANGQLVALGYIIGSGTYSTSTRGFMTLNQKSLQFTPASGEAGNITCVGLTISEGQTADISGATCNGQTFQSNGTSYGSGFTVIDGKTLSPCSESFVNCQFDLSISYVMQ
jgi:hypothetical protein